MDERPEVKSAVGRRSHRQMRLGISRYILRASSDLLYVRVWN
jgi:hypothetical protein